MFILYIVTTHTLHHPTNRPFHSYYSVFLTHSLTHTNFLLLSHSISSVHHFLVPSSASCLTFSLPLSKLSLPPNNFPRTLSSSFSIFFSLLLFISYQDPYSFLLSFPPTQTNHLFFSCLYIHSLTPKYFLPPLHNPHFLLTLSSFLIYSLPFTSHIFPSSLIVPSPSHTFFIPHTFNPSSTLSLLLTTSIPPTVLS